MPQGNVEVAVEVAQSFGEGSDARWRLPLEPLAKPMTPVMKTPAKTFDPAPLRESQLPPAAINGRDSGTGSGSGSGKSGGNGAAPSMDPVLPPDDAVDTVTTIETIESPDITTRFAVAQLAELNARVEELTKLATETTEISLGKVHSELRRITSLREVDLTEQAAGIFTAVQAGTEALGAFATVVREVTDDLRSILRDSLAAIGGSQGLAEAIAASQTDVISVREDFGAALARIERDLAVMRQRIPAKGVATQGAPAAAKVSPEQIDYIVEAVTEAVVGTLNAEKSARRR